MGDYMKINDVDKFDNCRSQGPCIHKAIPMYCNRFKITQDPKVLFDPKEVKDLAVKEFHEEKHNIENGVYAGRNE